MRLSAILEGISLDLPDKEGGEIITNKSVVCRAILYVACRIKEGRERDAKELRRVIKNLFIFEGSCDAEIRYVILLSTALELDKSRIDREGRCIYAYWRSNADGGFDWHERRSEDSRVTEFYGRKLSNERNWSISSEDIALIYDIRQPHNKVEAHKLRTGVIDTAVPAGR